MDISESLTYKMAVTMLKHGEPLPLDMETDLMQMGVDVPALKLTHEL